MKKREVFLLAILAGIAIAIGGTVFLSLFQSLEGRIIGSLLFTIGLYVIVLNGLFLYTGKIGYLVTETEKKDYGIALVLTWLGNLVGTGIGAAAILATRISGIRETAITLCETKLADTPLSIFILAIFCGILMYIAVDGYKEKGNPIILFMGVSVFILSGFEHCIANMFYYSLAGAWSVKAVIYLLIMTLGNSIGGMLIPAVKKMGKSR